MIKRQIQNLVATDIDVTDRARNSKLCGPLVTVLYMTESYVHTEQYHHHAYYNQVYAPGSQIAESHCL